MVWLGQRRKLTLSKAVLHALGCVATKIGFVDMVVWVVATFSQYFRYRARQVLYIPSKAFRDGTRLLSVFQINKPKIVKGNSTMSWYKSRRGSRAIKDARTGLAGGGQLGSLCTVYISSRNHRLGLGKLAKVN